jgi:hypothetical protein
LEGLQRSTRESPNVVLSDIAHFLADAAAHSKSIPVLFCVASDNPSLEEIREMVLSSGLKKRIFSSREEKIGYSEDMVDAYVRLAQYGTEFHSREPIFISCQMMSAHQFLRQPCNIVECHSAIRFRRLDGGHSGDGRDSSTRKAWLDRTFSGFVRYTQLEACSDDVLQGITAPDISRALIPFFEHDSLRVRQTTLDKGVPGREAET